MMDYFYCPPEYITTTSVLIEGEEFSHLVHVMRKKEGDIIRIVDGTGNAFDVRIGQIKNRAAHGSIQQSYRKHHESQLHVSLGVGILKNPSKFDFLVEKATELGVKEIIPLMTDRTIPSHAKVDRWQKIALSAMKQSCRSYLPVIRTLTKIHDLVLEQKPYDVRFIAHEQATGKLLPDSMGNSPPESVLILIGPEGGFSEEEIVACQAAGFMPVWLGDRRLRTETAAIVASAFILR